MFCEKHIPLGCLVFLENRIAHILAVAVEVWGAGLLNFRGRDDSMSKMSSRT